MLFFSQIHINPKLNTIFYSSSESFGCCFATSFVDVCQSFYLKQTVVICSDSLKQPLSLAHFSRILMVQKLQYNFSNLNPNRLELPCFFLLLDLPESFIQFKRTVFLSFSVGKLLELQGILLILYIIKYTVKAVCYGHGLVGNNTFGVN